MTTAAEFQAKTTKAVVNMDRLDQFLNGNNTATVTTDNGEVPSIAKLAKDTQDALGEFGDAAELAESLEPITDDLALGAASKISKVAAIDAAVTTLAAREADIAELAALDLALVIANVDNISTMVAGLTGTELTAIRKANQQVEKDRLANLTASIGRFVSTAGSDANSGRAMARAKSTVAGLVASLDYGITSLTVGGTNSGGTPGTYRIGVAGGTPYRAATVEMRVSSGGIIQATQNGWTRAIDGGDYADGSAVPTLTIPAAANLGAATLTATLGRVAKPGEVLGFEHGSRWAEQYVVRTPGVTVCSFAKGGKTRLPLFDCTDPVGAWTLDSGNVWVQTIGRAADYQTVGGEDNYSLFEDTAPSDPGSGYRWMTRVPSKALCDSTPDSYFIPEATFFAEASATTLIYVHAAGSVNPNTKSYRYNRRTQGVFGRDRLPNLTIDGISCVGPLSAQGSVNAGTNFLFRRAVLANGGKHDCVFESGLLEDVISYNTEVIANRQQAYPTALGALDCIPFTAYRDDPAGLTATLRRCMQIQPPGKTGVGFFFSHSSGSSPTARYDETLLEGFISNNGGAVKGAQSIRQIYRALFLKDLRGTAVQPGRGQFMSGVHFENTHGLFIPDATMGSAGGALLTGGGNSTGVTWANDEAEVIIRHNGIYNNHDETLGLTSIVVNLSARQKIDVSNNTIYQKGRQNFVNASMDATAGSEGIKNNILIRNLANIGSFVQWIQLPVGFTGACDYNVYIDLQANTNLRWRQGSTSYTFANWQALGFDTHSVVLNAAQAADLFLNGVAGLANGDFRLNPACTLQFTDGALLVGRAGIQEYYDWNARQYVVGQPKKWPVHPTTWAECQAYAFDPTAWNHYP
ncbi:MAG: hypothetical protein A2885_09435 [Sphingopyxis sp. RIFCSPHIGHO2_01_FULL_65_24]|nr:MAG: hypothetical protein A2885_09435 [Sphingopyxis sp. RIFCSPHIGHO2_01_FULL_65_24]